MNCEIVKHSSRNSWLKDRARYITATDAVIVAGESKWGSPYSLWVDKLKGVEPKEPSELALVGQMFEAPCAKLFEKLSGLKTKNLGRFTLLVSRDYPWMACTLDRLTQEGNAGGETGVVEIKVRNSFSREDWTEGRVPSSVYVQIQHQLLVTGLTFGYAFGLVGGFPVYTRVERDNDFISNLVKLEQTFWNCVKTETPPEIDASQNTKDAILRLHPDDNGQEVSIHALDEWSEVRELNKQIKELQDRVNAHKNAIMAQIGNATWGRLSDGTLLSFKTQERAEYTVKASKHRVLMEVAKRK